MSLNSFNNKTKECFTPLRFINYLIFCNFTFIILINFIGFLYNTTNLVNTKYKKGFNIYVNSPINSVYSAPNFFLNSCNPATGFDELGSPIVPNSSKISFPKSCESFI